MLPRRLNKTTRTILLIAGISMISMANAMAPLLGG